MPGTMRVPNSKMGDVRLAWDEAQEAEMEALIQKKMDQGLRFFIVEASEAGDGKQLLLRNQKIPNRQVFIPDADVGKMFTETTMIGAPITLPSVLGDKDLDVVVGSGIARLFHRIMGEIKTIRQTLTAAEAARSNTLVMRPFQGG